jgi:hypothetical protein
MAEVSRGNLDGDALASSEFWDRHQPGAGKEDREFMAIGEAAEPRAGSERADEHGVVAMNEARRHHPGCTSARTLSTTRSGVGSCSRSTGGL